MWDMSKIRSENVPATAAAPKADPKVSIDAMLRKGDPAIAKISDEAVLKLFPERVLVTNLNTMKPAGTPSSGPQMTTTREGTLDQLELWSNHKTPEWRAAVFDLYARGKNLGVDLRATRGQLASLADVTGPVERPALERLAKALGMSDALPALKAPAKTDSVDKTKAPKPTPAQVQVVQQRAAEESKAAASVQAQRGGSLFGVQEAIGDRSDVKSLLTGSRVTDTDVNKLLAAGVSAKDLNAELVKGGAGPMAPLLTPEAMGVLLKQLGTKDDFLTQASQMLPRGMSVNIAEQKLAEREGIGAEAQHEALVAQGMTPQEATRTLLSSLGTAPVTNAELPKPPSGAKPPVAPALADPQGENAQLQQLLQVPAFKSIFLDTTNRPVTAQDMTAMIDAVGPQGLKALGSAVVFGSGGIADRLQPEAMNTFLQAVHTQTNGASAGGVPANVYGRAPIYAGPAAYASTPLQFAQDPTLQYLGQTYGNNWGAYAASAALSMTAGNLMPYAANFMYGYPNAYSYSPYTYAGAGLYNPFMPQTTGQALGTAAGMALGGVVGGALIGAAEGMLGMGGWGMGYGGYYNPGGMWGMGVGSWGAYPGNMFGYNMMSGGWPYAMSMW
jgi:hypothetical protein